MTDGSTNVMTDNALKSGVTNEVNLGTRQLSKGQAGSGSEITMRVKIQSPQKIFFDEVAISISAANATGDFDILPHHHNFITLLDPCEMCIRRPGKADEQRIKISGGLMHVKSDLVTIFLDV